MLTISSTRITNPHREGMEVVELNSTGRTSAKKSAGSLLSYHAIRYAVTVTEKGCWCCAQRKEKVILDDVSGLMSPGMNAILGPTGSGKTTLLNILAGRLTSSTSITGCVLLDGNPLPENFKLMSGYVVQDDIVMGTLTVRENLLFSAALRLPRSVSKAERENRVDGVLEDLGLTKVANSKVGTDFLRGISGGERKRTNIGMELIVKPNILFLDEPTTGLDAHTAVSVIRLLRDLSANATIIFSIHQPRYSIFKLFDRLTLLGCGQTVYHGLASNALKFFDENGFVCEEHDNPADFFLDTVQEMIEGEKKDGEDEKKSDNEILPLVKKFNESSYSLDLDAELKPLLGTFLGRGQDYEVKKVPLEYPTGYLYQFFVLSKRALINTIRNPMLSIMQVATMLIFGIIVGLIFLQLELDEKGIQNRVGAFFFIIINLVFGNLGSIEVFMGERPIFRHESASGYYHIFVYFLARVGCDLLFVNILPYFLFACVTYWMIGFQADAGKFFYYVAIILLTAMSGNGISYAVGAGVRVFALGTLMCALIYTIMMVFGGLFLNLSSIPVWLRWLKWLSVFRYALEAMSYNEIDGLLFCSDEIRSNGSCVSGFPDVVTGASYLDSQDFVEASLWFAPMALALFFFVFLVIAYLELRFKKLNK